MSYISNIGFKDATTDPFGRLRTSSPHTVLDLKQLRNSLPLFFSDVQVSGIGGATTSTYLTNQAATRLAVTSGVAGRRVRQSKLRGIYQTGKGLLIETTWNFKGGATGITKSAGYFDDKNGVGLRLAGNTLYSFVRSFTSGVAVDNAVPQSSWNIDRFDGQGASGLLLDLTKTQIGGIDFQWLGVGRVRMALNIDGKQLYFHEYLHANRAATVYMSTPNLPIRYEIENSGTGTNNLTMDCICASIVSEGGQDEIVQSTHIDRDNSPASIVTGTFTPVLSVRLQTGAEGVRVVPLEVGLFTDQAMSYVWRLYLNPTIAADNVSWNDIPNSGIAYDVTRTSTQVVTDGYVIAGDYGGSTNQVKTPVGSQVKSFLTLGFDVLGNSDQFVLAVKKLSGAGTDIYANMTFGEFA